MLLFVSEGKDHDPRLDSAGGHIEIPERIGWCLEALESTGVNLDRRAFSPATRAQLTRVHQSSYLDQLKELCRSGGGVLPGPTFVGERSLEEALSAAGASVAAARAVWETSDVAMALVRPPGHHAERAVGQGFCLVNNAAVAAQAAKDLGARKVAIVDIDVHHGNGTQNIFWENGGVLYLSLHQYPWYPWVTGSLGEVGAKDGKDRNVNIPLPAGSGDETYRSAFEKIVDPIVSAFHPELLVVSAGFDAHQRDDISLMEVTASGFGWMGGAIRNLAESVCNGKVLVCLEGGYDEVGLPSSLARFVLGMSAGSEYRPEIKQLVGNAAVESAAAFHLPRWRLA